MANPLWQVKPLTHRPKKDNFESMTMRKLKSDIRKLLVERNAILLAHNYQRDEIQEVADLTGDSLGLSIEASKTEAK